MKEIKTRETVKDIRTLDRPASITGRMKNAYVRTKEQVEQTQRTDADSPANYAEDRATEKAQEMTRETGHILRHQGRKIAEKTWQRIRGYRVQEDTPAREQAHRNDAKPLQSSRKSEDYISRGREFAHDSARRYKEHSVINYGREETRQSVKTVERGIRQSTHTSEQAVKTGARGSIKTVERGVKTAEQTSRVAVKTTQATAKKAVQTAQATAKAAQRATQASKVAARAAAAAAKTLAKAVAAATKAIVATVKELVAAIVAGGWVAVVIIVVVLLAAAIFGSVFGIFASEKGYDSMPSMSEVVSQINADFSDKINAVIDDNPHDRLVINNAGSASMVRNWNEVLAVYDVLVATDPENPIEVATLDDSKVSKLKTVFWGMNSICYSLSGVEIGTDEETGEPITETVLTITVSDKTAEDMIAYYGFSAARAAQVRELLQPEYAELFMRLTGSYQNITLSAAEIAEIIKTLPADLSEERKNVVLIAYSLLGKVHYFWGGKSLVTGWDSRWGMPMKVMAAGSPSTSTVRPFGVDCSGFVDWVFYNVSGGEYVIGHGGGAIAQYSYCDAILWDSAQPGDLAFYPGCEHVGIVVKNDGGTLTVIHCASGGNNVVMTQNTQGNGFTFAGKPQIL